MPVSRIVWGTELTGNEIPFLQTHILAAFGILGGLVLGRSLAVTLAPAMNSLPAPLSRVRCLVFSSAALVIVFAYIYYSVGFNLSNFLTPYGFERSLVNETSTLDTLTTPLATVLILHSYLGAYAGGRRSRRVRSFVLMIAAAASLILLIRGNRNPSLIMWLPIAALARFNRRLPLIPLVLTGLAAFALYSGVAVVRNVGLADAGGLPVTLESMDPARGELGTSFNVYSIFGSDADSGVLKYGTTYTTTFVTNLVPMALWPNRPKSTAVEFSQKYFGTDELEFGVGFSPVVEAMTNFGWLGILPIFTVFAALVVVVARYLLSKGRWGLLSYSMMLPMIVNWNRIDSNASGKMFLVYIGLFFIFDYLMYIRATRHSAVWSSSPPTGRMVPFSGRLG